MAEFILETNYPSQTDNKCSINLVLRRIMGKSRLRPIRLLARPEDVVNLYLDGM